MKADDLVDLAARNLRESMLRSSLTTLGIGVGVASLVAMLSLGIGLQQLADRRLARSGLFDAIVVTSRRSLRGFDRADNRNGAPPAESRLLDEKARAEMARLPNVLEAVPDIRFISEVRYEGKPHLAMVAGLPLSARDKDAFDSMQGRFFSSDAADEAILQIQFADELLGIGQKLGESSPKLSGQTQTLIGKELTLRYAERVPSAAAPESKPVPAEEGGGAGARSGALKDTHQPPVMGAFSVVPRERKLRIVAVTDRDPEGMRGVSGTRVFIPLQMVENLHVMLSSGLRGSEPDFSNALAYPSLSVRVRSPNRVESVQDAIRKMGFNTYSILDATRSLRRFFAVLRPLSWDLRQPRAGGCRAGDREYASDGHPRAPPRNRNHEGDRRQRRGRQEAFPCRGRGDGLGGWDAGSGAGLGDRPADQRRRERLSAPSKPAVGELVGGSVVAGCRSDCLRHRDQHDLRALSGRTSRQAGSRAGSSLRMMDLTGPYARGPLLPRRFPPRAR